MEKIFSEILENARKEAENAVRVATKVAQREVEYAQKDAEALCERYKSENASELQAVRERIIVSGERENKKQELAQRQRIVKETLEWALEIFRREGRSGKFGELYKQWLGKKLAEAASCFKGEVVLTCAKEDKELIGSLWQDERKPVLSIGEMAGGFILSDLDQRISVDCTIESIVRNNEEKWRDLIMQGFEG